MEFWSSSGSIEQWWCCPKSPKPQIIYSQVQVVPPSGWGVSQWNDVILLSHCSCPVLLGPLSPGWPPSRDDPLRMGVVTMAKLIVKARKHCLAGFACFPLSNTQLAV